MPEKNLQLAAARSTEGNRVGVETSGSQKRRGPGRPKGAKNKPKSLLPVEVADQILLQMKDMLPAEHFAYIKGVVRDGKAISTKTELDTLILILNRNLLPALVMEGQITEDDADDVKDFFTDEDDGNQAIMPNGARVEDQRKKLKMPVFRKDVTERLKVMQGLLTLRQRIETHDSDSRDEQKPILTILARRGTDGGRIRILAGVESGSLVGDADGVGRAPDEVGALPDQVSERPELLSSGEQSETDWVLDYHSSGGTAGGGDEGEVHG